MIPYGVYDLAANEALVYLARGPTPASWPVTQFAAGGTDWASGAGSDESDPVAGRLRRQQWLSRAAVSAATAPIEPASVSHVPRVSSSAVLLEIQSHRPPPVLPLVTLLAGDSTHQHRSHPSSTATNDYADWPRLFANWPARNTPLVSKRTRIPHRRTNATRLRPFRLQL